MATPVIMPKFGMAQEDGTIIRWLKHEGEQVTKGETILEVQTDKVDMDVEAPATGILRDVRYGVDATIPVTTVIASIADPGEEARIALSAAQPAAQAAAQTAAPDGAGRPRISPVAQRMAAAQGVDIEQVQGSGARGRITAADIAPAAPEPEPESGSALADSFAHSAPRTVRATPAARRLAVEAGVSLQDVVGSGPEGRVHVADINAAVAARVQPAGVIQPDPNPPVPPADLGAPLQGMRRIIAGRLARSWQEIPHIFLQCAIDMTEVEALRQALAPELEASGARLTLNTILAYATVAALVRRPRLNAWLRSRDGEHFVSRQQQVNLGFAVALDDGLIVPVVQDAGQLKLAAFAQKMEALASCARTGELTPDDVAGGTFTISNLGMYPVTNFTALINPPQIAILAIGRMQMRPVWNGAAFAPRPVIEVTLAADHRAVDGAIAAQFLTVLKQLLEEPRMLLL